MIFSPQWFTRHQKILLWFANSWMGRRILCINGQKSSVGKNKIIKILPNSITWKTGKKYHTEFRTHDKFGKRLFYAFKPFWYLCHLWDMTWYPRFNLGFDSLTAYPAVQSEPDNSIYAQDESAWATPRNASSGTLRTRTDKLIYSQATLSGSIRFIERTFINFDTSTLTDGANISAATFSVYVTTKSIANSPSFRLYNSTAQDSLVEGDYDQMGTTEQSDSYITDPTTSAYSDLALNAAGLSAISKTGLTKHCLRDAAYDLANTQPGGVNTIILSNSNETGTTQDPKLVVTYTLPMGGYIFISS